MSIVSKGTKITLTPSNKIPDGFTPPSVEAFKDYRYSAVRRTLQVPKSDVEDSDPVTTLTNIIQDNTVGIEKQITDMLTADWGGSNPNTIDFWVHLMGLTLNVIPPDKTSDFLNNSAVVYECDTITYIRVTPP